MLLFNQFNDSWLVVNFQPTLFAHSIWILIGIPRATASNLSLHIFCSPHPECYMKFVRECKKVYGQTRCLQFQKADVERTNETTIWERIKNDISSIRCCKRLNVKFRIGHEAQRKIGKMSHNKKHFSFDVGAAINTEFETFMWIRV